VIELAPLDSAARALEVATVLDAHGGVMEVSYLTRLCLARAR
jgi:hypothetical protein